MVDAVDGKASGVLQPGTEPVIGCGLHRMDGARPAGTCKPQARAWMPPRQGIRSAVSA